MLEQRSLCQGTGTGERREPTRLGLEHAVQIEATKLSAGGQRHIAEEELAKIPLQRTRPSTTNVDAWVVVSPQVPDMNELVKKPAFQAHSLTCRSLRGSAQAIGYVGAQAGSQSRVVEVCGQGG